MLRDAKVQLSEAVHLVGSPESFLISGRLSNQLIQCPKRGRRELVERAGDF